MGFGKKRSSKVGIGAITTSKKKLFAEGGMMDDGKDVDPVSGNDVPTGSLAEEVRDDIDAKLSPGEFVFPADIVRFIGLERLMQMRDQAKKGLMRMNDIGQMGNAEDVGEKADDTYEDDDEFESEIDNIMKEVDREGTDRQTEMAFNTGGFVNPSYYDLTKAPKNPALDIRYFNDSQGKTFYMPFINGKPMKPMPNGAVQTGQPSAGGTTGGTTGGETETKTGGGSVVGGAAAGGSTLLVGSKTTGGGNTDTTTEKSTGSISVSGTYDGSNIKDFGRSDLIYNPGGSGKGGEVVTEDLWQNSVSKWQVNLGSAALSTLAAAAGVPGILTMGLRAATNKYGVDKVNSFFAQANQETVAKAGGIDVNAPGGRAAAASQIDQLRSRDDQTAAATAGATGTGGRAADVGKYVYEQLKDTGLGDDEIAAAAQKAVDAVIRGESMATAVSNAVSEARPDFGVRMSDMDAAPSNEGSMYGGNFMDAVQLQEFSKDIGFDWGSMGDFGTAGGTGFKDFGNNDMIVPN